MTENQNLLKEVLLKVFNDALKQRVGLMVIFKYDLSFEVFAFGDYGFKLAVEKEIDKVLSKYTQRAQKHIDIGNARVSFKLTKDAGVKVKYHRSDDTTTMVDREELIMFYNFD